MLLLSTILIQHLCFLFFRATLSQQNTLMWIMINYAQSNWIYKQTWASEHPLIHIWKISKRKGCGWFSGTAENISLFSALATALAKRGGGTSPSEHPDCLRHQTHPPLLLKVGAFLPLACLTVRSIINQRPPLIFQVACFSEILTSIRIGSPPTVKNILRLLWMKVQSNVYIFHSVHYLLYRKRKKAFLLLGIFKIVIKEPPVLKNLL